MIATYDEGGRQQQRRAIHVGSGGCGTTITRRWDTIMTYDEGGRQQQCPIFE